MKTAPMKTTPKTAALKTAAPLDAVLRRSGEELARLAGRLAALEHHIGDLAAGEAGGLRAEAALGLQDLDHIRQTAEALGAFLLRLSDAAPACAVDLGAAAAAVPLAALAARLTGGSLSRDAGGDEFEVF